MFETVQVVPRPNPPIGSDNVERINYLARTYLDPATESASWLVTRHTDGTDTFEWLIVEQPDPARRREFHDMLSRNLVIVSSNGVTATRTTYTPRPPDGM